MKKSYKHLTARETFSSEVIWCSPEASSRDVHEIKSAVVDDELELTNNGKQQL